MPLSIRRLIFLFLIVSLLSTTNVKSSTTATTTSNPATTTGTATTEHIEADSVTTEVPETTTTTKPEPTRAALENCNVYLNGTPIPVLEGRDVCFPSTFYANPTQIPIVLPDQGEYANETLRCYIRECPGGTLRSGDCCFRHEWIIGFAAGVGSLIILILIIVIIVMACAGGSAAAAGDAVFPESAYPHELHFIRYNEQMGQQ